MDTLDYGAIGNCKSAALISSKGSIDWLCLPYFDSPSIFARILDKDKGGHLSILVDESFSIKQRYLEHTNILCTFFESKESAFQVFDFMPRYPIDEFGKHFLPPELYRLFRVTRGTPKIRIEYKPALNYARDDACHEHGPTFIKTVSQNNIKDYFYLYSNLELESILNTREIELKQDSFLLFSYNQKLIPIDQNRVELEFQRTKVYWLNWSNRSRKFTAYSKEIERSLLILKLMSYQPTGAVLAALTTSIPETIGENRNWDYRFCWLRDASMSIQTLLTLGHRGAASDFMEFILTILRSKDESFQIMYGIRGERILTEQTLNHLSGFADSRPVRIGNAAYFQKQNDSLGYLMDVIWQYYQHFLGTLSEIEDIWTIVKNIVYTVYEEWHDPDQGIWEIRGAPQHFVHSKVMSWVALDRGIRIAEFLNKPNYAKKWSTEAELIRNDIFEHGWKENIQSFSQTYENEELDASLLLMTKYGFLPAEDERFFKTVRAIHKRLMHNGLMFRYKNKDDFGTPKSAFTICTFWMIQALYSIGEKEEAFLMFKQIQNYSNHLGLFSEDLDFESKKQLGNFPQAYSHLAFINTALLFSEEIELSRFIRP
jgi:alpha,alpha-trehalase